MRARVALGVAFAAALVASCTASSRQKTLRIFFDGVPPPPPVATSEVSPGPGGSVETAVAGPAIVEHAPYATKQCDGCHDRNGVGGLVAPRQELCLTCHDLPRDKRYVHGPLAAGDCLVCHRPHSSPNRYLLVSASDTFCFHCHASADLTAVDGHQGESATCTRCHDPHMSDRKYLLR